MVPSLENVLPVLRTRFNLIAIPFYRASPRMVDGDPSFEVFLRFFLPPTFSRPPHCSTLSHLPNFPNSPEPFLLVFEKFTKFSRIPPCLLHQPYLTFSYSPPAFPTFFLNPSLPRPLLWLLVAGLFLFLTRFSMLSSWPSFRPELPHRRPVSPSPRCFPYFSPLQFFFVLFFPPRSSLRHPCPLLYTPCLNLHLLFSLFFLPPYFFFPLDP